MRRIGLVVNPIAGMGGRVGLKGTDGMVDQARERGAERRAADRARAALAALADAAPDATVLTYAGVMGADAATDAGFEPTVVGAPAGDPADPYATTAADTRAAVRTFVEHDVDCILFVGGDGTAVDVATALDAADADTPMLGVPAGVKVYSAVFGVSPAAAGRLAGTFDRTEEREVVDIDEDAYRDGTVTTALHAVVAVPVGGDLQERKSRPGGNVEGLAAGVAADIDPDRTYVFGPGGTVGAIERELGIEPSPLGVDVYRDGDLLVRDGGERAILDALGEDNEIVVSPIGGQGFVFGRGNQQLSPAVIRACAVTIVATRDKLAECGVLRVDTGDEALDADLRGWWRVRTGRYATRLVELV
jgi:predicted polyphosphate/ATP-dependent NAD kinase